MVDGGHPVTVLIPAFNEEKVIVSTVERILASDYRELEVLVIDDGSKDHTAYIVRSHFMRDRRVGVISIPNGGKANALNVGLSNARGEVVVALDADTQFNADTISRLVRWFDDPSSRRRGGQCQGRQPHQHDHALAGAGIYRGAESGTPRACRPWTR